MSDDLSTEEVEILITLDGKYVTSLSSVGQTDPLLMLASIAHRDQSKPFSTSTNGSELENGVVEAVGFEVLAD